MLYRYRPSGSFLRLIVEFENPNNDEIVDAKVRYIYKGGKAWGWDLNDTLRIAVEECRPLQSPNDILKELL